MTTLGVILAGGFNRRMGSPKHALRALDGRTFAEIARDALVPMVEGRVLVMGPAEVLPELPHAMDEPRGRGPLAGIDAAFTAIPEVAPDAGQILVIPCDAPRLTSELLARLLEAKDRSATIFGPIEGKNRDSSHLLATREMGTVPVFPEFFPLPVWLARDAAAVVRERLDRGELALHALLDELQPHVIGLDARETKLLANINTPEEYTTYLAESAP